MGTVDPAYGSPVDRLKAIDAEFQRQFGRQPTIHERAPGRVDLMGSHTDYNLGLVMTMAIDRDTVVAAATVPQGSRHDDCVSVYSMNSVQAGAGTTRAGEYVGAGTADLNNCALQRFRLRPASVNATASPNTAGSPELQTAGWARYVEATALAATEAGIPVRACSLMIHSTVPIGAGLSSSAALECAVLRALIALFGDPSTSPSPIAQVHIAKRAENSYVGVQCGILDQYSSVMAMDGRVVVLDCRTITHTLIPVSKQLLFVACNTNTPRGLSTSHYGERRAQCESGVRELRRFLPGIESLRDVSLSDFERFGAILDPLVRARCRFIIEESERVTSLAEALRADDQQAVSQLFRDSFIGARDGYGIVVPTMERMFESMIAAPGCVGARQAGAGFGGCLVAVVRSPKVEAFVAATRETYTRTTGIEPDVYVVRPAPGASRVSVGIRGEYDFSSSGGTIPIVVRHTR